MQRAELSQQRQQWTAQQADLASRQQQCNTQQAQLQQEQQQLAAAHQQLAAAQQRLAASQRQVGEEGATLFEAQTAAQAGAREVEARMSACMRLEGVIQTWVSGEMAGMLACA